MKSLMQHNTLARAAWLPLMLASGACSMDLPLGDMSRDEPDLLDDGSSEAVPATLDGAVAPTLLPSDVSFGMGEELWGLQPVVGADLDADGYDDLAMVAHDVATGVEAVQIRYGGPRPSGPGEAYRMAESGPRLLLPERTAASQPVYNGIFAAGDVDGDGYVDLFVTNGVCDGSGPERGGYLIYGGPERLDGVIDIASVSTHFIPPSSTGDGLSCADLPATAPGDLDGDGLSDLVLVYPGSISFWVPSGEGPKIPGGAPGIYVFYGRREGFGPSVSWTSADARMSSALSGDPEHERDGITVHTVGDLNGDGSAELGINYVPAGVFSPSPDEPAMPLPPEQILVPGGERPASTVDLTTLPLRIPGLITQRGERALGDVDGDGFDDILARFGADADYMLFYGAPDLLDAPLDRAHAAARIVTEYNGGPVPLGDLDGDGDTELGVGRYIPHRPWPETIDVAVLSGTRARLSGDVSFVATSLAGARIYPGAPQGETRSVSFIAPVGDLDGDGAGDVLTRSAADFDELGDPSVMLHLHYGIRAQPAISSVPR